MNWYLIDLPDFKACIQAPTKIHAQEIIDELHETDFGFPIQLLQLIKGAKIAPPLPIKQVRQTYGNNGFPQHNRTDEDQMIRHKQGIIKINYNQD